MVRLDGILRACIPAVVLGLSAGFATTVRAAPELLPGTYRCSAYNVSGGGGSCRTMPPLVLDADGSYGFSSSRGRWTVHDGRLALSESQVWGTGVILGGNAVRFEYDYRGWRHTVTWTCQECASGTGGTADPSPGAYVGVSLTLQFAQPVGGVSGYAIVPAEVARSYTHNGPLPDGAVQGLAWEAGPAAVSVATNRNNKLRSGRRYVVFLFWPRESVPVALLEIPPMEGDYTATLPASLDGDLLVRHAPGNAPAAPPDPAPDGAPQAFPGGTYPQSAPAAAETPPGNPAPPPAAQGGMPEGGMSATPEGSAPAPQSGPGTRSGLQDFLSTVEQLGKALEGLKRRGGTDRDPGYPGTEPPGSFPPESASYPESEPSGSYPSPPPGHPSPEPSGSGPPAYPGPPSPAYAPGSAVPGYDAAQGGAGAMSPPPPRCNPQIPKYSQPGCVE